MFRVVSRLDIKSNFVIKGVQFEGLRKIGDPVELAIQRYLEGADEIFFIDAVASLYGRNHLTSLVSRASANIFIPITVGGGIRTFSDAQELFSSGADKIVINTGNFKYPNLTGEISSKYGRQAVVGSVQAKRVGDEWFCLTEQGREKTGEKVANWIEKLTDQGVGEFLITSVDQDGTLKGFDLELAELALKSTDRPVVLSGGCGSLQDIQLLATVNKLSGVSMSSALYNNSLSIQEVKVSLGAIGIPTRKTGNDE